jgi:Zn-dependent peptidase ImmA (M78 family)/transcriptional regulator with XRE-family HTH domain
MDLQKTIGLKIRQLRNQSGLSVRALSERLDFSNHQAVLHLENGERELKAHELSKLAKIFNIDMNDFFRNDEQLERPFVLWRARSDAAPEAEARFLRVCRDHGLFEELLGTQQSAASSPLPKRVLNLERFSASDAYDFAEDVRNRMSLGVYPAQILVQTLEDQYGVRFFQETRSGQGSAACTYFAGKPCLLVSTSEPIWRQHFSVAHELFHLLTWDEKLFQQVSDNDHLREKNETRADAFAAGLLMPAEALRAEVRRVATDGKLSHAALITIARHFDVSLRACAFRLAHLRIITQSDAQRLIEDPTLRDLDKQTQREATRTAYQFNKAFTRLAYLCYEAGKISRARLAKALEVSLVDLPMFLNMAGLAEVEGEARVEVAYS